MYNGPITTQQKETPYATAMHKVWQTWDGEMIEGLLVSHLVDVGLDEL